MRVLTLIFLPCVLPVFCLGQGTFVYDQQSTNLIEGSAPLQAGQPMGQSFTPSLPFVNFIELILFDSDALHNSGATARVNLRADSITGTLLGTSAAVFPPNNFFGITNFIFAIPVTVALGAMSYFQPVIQSGDNVSSYVTDASYSGGSAIYQGVARSDFNLWFREGILVPEPSSVALLAWLGGALFLRLRLRRRKS